MSPEESWETESKEQIDICLACPLPDYLCTGRGDCYANKRRHRGQLEHEVYKLVLMEKKTYQMAHILNVSQKTIQTTMTRLIRKKVITKEQAYKTHVNHSRKMEES